MPHKNKLLEIISDLRKTSSVVSLNALDFLHHTAQYAREYQGEKTMSNETAQRVHAVFTLGMKQGAYNLSQTKRHSTAKYLYHRPAKELGIA